MKIVRESLNEELLGTIKSPWNALGDLYKNPPTIRRMGQWVRAITNKNGDLYIVDSPDIIHNDIINYLTEIGEISKLVRYWDSPLKEDNPEGIIAWQRKGNTMELYLSESYGMMGQDMENEIPEEWYDEVSLRNPAIGFINEVVPSNGY